MGRPGLAGRRRSAPVGEIGRVTRMDSGYYGLRHAAERGPRKHRGAQGWDRDGRETRGKEPQTVGPWTLDLGRVTFRGGMLRGNRLVMLKRESASRYGNYLR